MTVRSEKTRFNVIISAIAVFLVCLMPIGCSEAPITPAPETSAARSVPETADPPVTNETAAPYDPYARENVLIVDFLADSSDYSPYYYTTWENLDVSRLLNSGLKQYKSYTDKYFVINVFRRNGEDFYSDFRYEGKTLSEWGDEALAVSHRATLIEQLLKNLGEILKYGKEVITGTGVPTDDPLIPELQRGERWAASFYDKTVAQYNECDTGMLSRYIVGGDFLSELAERDLALLDAEYNSISAKISEMDDFYFARHEQGDLALFESLGFKAGEVNGKLYIFATADQLRGLAARADMSPFSFTPLPSEDYLTAYPVSDLPDDYTVGRSVSGFALEKFVFYRVDIGNGLAENFTPSNEEEFYSAIEANIRRYKRGSLYLELQFHAKNKSGARYCIDISELEGLKYSGYSISKTSVLTAVKLRHEDFNDPEIMRALCDLSQREEITWIEISPGFYVP